MASGPITSWQIDGETMETVTDYLLRLQNHCWWWLQPWNYKTLALWKKSYDQPRQHIKKQRHYFAKKLCLVKAMVFPVVHVWMWELNYIESPLDGKEIQPVHPKGNPSWMFIVRTDAEGKTPILWLSDAKNSLIWEDSDAGTDWKWEMGTTEDEMFGWHHQLNGHEFE